MNHLNDEQLSALADGALAVGERAAAERHLEACAACRDALAGLLARDRGLRGALEHDPGDAYFEGFGARVGGRIRAAGLGGAQARAPESRGLADWFRSPRKLTVVGAVATVVVGAGIVMMSTREVSLPVRRGSPLEDRAARPAPGAPTVAPPAVTPPEAGPLAAATDETPPAAAPPAVTRASKATAPPPARSRQAPPAATAPPERPLAAALAEDRGAGVPTGPANEAAPAPMLAREPGAGPAAGLAAPSPAALSARDVVEGEAAPPVSVQRARQSLATAREEKAGADAFAGQPTFTSLHGRNARRLTALAETMRIAPAWDSAAEEWANVLLGTQGSPLETETRYQLCRTRHRAWLAGATEKRATRAGEAFAAFLATAPAGAQRDSVKAWRVAVGK